MSTEFDVTNLRGRRASQRWNRTAVGDILERLTWSRPDQEAIVGWPGAFADPAYERVTYRQADETANRVANAFIAAGLEPADRVIFYCDNSVEALLTMMGAAKAGLVCVPVNPLMAPDVLTWAIDHVEASFAIVDAELWPKAEPAFGATGMRPGVTIPIGGGAIEGTETFGDWIAGQAATEPDVEIHGDDVWSLLFTSGTTAMPKAVMSTHTYSHMAAMTYTLSLTRGLRLESDLRLLTFLPIVYHCGHHAAFFAAFFAGGTAIVGRRPDAVQTVAAITRERATAVWAGSPLLLQGIADAAEADPSADLRSLTVALFSWSTMHPALVARLKALAGEDLGLLEVFGQTEAMSCYRFWEHEWPEKVEASRGTVNHVGAPNPVLAATVMGPDGEILQGTAGVPGEAVYRSPAITAGYYRDEDATREAFRHGWFHSGDSCAYEEDGTQVMVDRYKDIVKSGGENVSSPRVEGALIQHPDVARVAVIGLPHERWGEIVCAVVVAAAGRRPPDEELIAFCRERLAGYETPKRIIWVDELPETVGGKILKYRLREQYGPARLADGAVLAP
jgi:acyl-CoA synthetase (AMP-forming)/AMP-acid ligase II